MTENVFGVDVARDRVDVAGPRGVRRVMNEELDALAAEIAACGGRAVFEASGGYETPLREALARAGATAVRVNPARARSYARAMGRLAKTDRADAAVLRRMGQRHPDLPRTPLESEDLRKLKALHARRRQLVEDRKREKTRRAQAREPFVLASIERVIALFCEEIAALEARIAELVASTPDFAERAKLMRSAPGIGPVAVAALLAEMPELGTLTPGAAAALVGLAPIARDSGYRTGKRRIGGGRKPLRDTLYMAALSAARHAPVLSAFATRLREAGKAPKQAVIAVARKLIVILNAMIRDGRAYQIRA